MPSKNDGVPDIGFDPLAWMHAGPAEAAKAIETKAPTKGRGSKKSAARRKKKRAENQATEVLRLSDNLEIAYVNDLFGALKGQLDKSAGIVLDGSNVGRVDAAALQLLAACAREARAKGIGLRWVAASDSLVNGSKLLGLAEILQLESR